MKHHDQKAKLGRKEFIWCTCPYLCSSWKEIRTRTHTGQEPESKNWCRGHRGVLLIDLLLIVFSACFLIESRITIPEMTPSTMGCALPHQSLIKEMPYRNAYNLILWKYFHNWDSLFSDNFSLCVNLIWNYPTQLLNLLHQLSYHHPLENSYYNLSV